MIHLQKNIKEYIKKLFSDVHSAIVGIIVAALFLSIGSIYLFAKNLWTELLKTMQLPTPLWATIILVFGLLAYIYLKQQKPFNHRSLQTIKSGISLSATTNGKQKFMTVVILKLKNIHIV